MGKHLGSADGYSEAVRMSGLLHAADNAPTPPQKGSDVASHPGHLIAKAHVRLRYHLIRNTQSAV
jgi:hypothetical protein